MYVVTRADLPAGFAAAQCVHAAFLFARDRWEQAAPWMRDSQWLVLVTTPDEDELHALCSRAQERRIGFTQWREPDRDDELTAVAFCPGKDARRLCANLPLLGRDGRSVIKMGTGPAPAGSTPVDLTGLSPRDQKDLVQMYMPP